MAAGQGLMRLRAGQRVRDAKDFQSVYAGRQKVHTSLVIVCYGPNGLQTSRLGVSVGSKHGNAVRRNRIKRVLRAAFRMSQAWKGRQLLPPGLDYVLIPQNGAAEKKEFSSAGVLRSLEEAGRKIAARLPTK